MTILALVELDGVTMCSATVDGDENATYFMPLSDDNVPAFMRSAELGDLYDLQGNKIDEEAEERILGGKGSGNYGHAGRPGERGGSENGPRSGNSEKAVRALAAHNPFTREKERWATKNEQFVVGATKGQGTDNNLPVDVVVETPEGKTLGIEVKTMLDNKASKITMRTDALQRKYQWARQNHASLHTVVIDDRNKYGKKELYSGHRIYYRKGVGSFRIESMIKVRDEAHLKDLLRGKVKK